MADTEGERDERPEQRNVVINIDPPTRRQAPLGPCPVAGRHRWAYLTAGGQACGYCGKPRPA